MTENSKEVSIGRRWKLKTEENRSGVIRPVMTVVSPTQCERKLLSRYVPIDGGGPSGADGMWSEDTKSTSGQRPDRHQDLEVNLQQICQSQRLKMGEEAATQQCNDTNCNLETDGRTMGKAGSGILRDFDLMLIQRSKTSKIKKRDTGEGKERDPQGTRPNCSSKSIQIRFNKNNMGSPPKN